MLNFYSPQLGAIQVAGTGIITLFCADGTMRKEDGIYTLPEDAQQIGWAEFSVFFDNWRTVFRHADEDFSEVYELMESKTIKKKNRTARVEFWKAYALPTSDEILRV